MKNTKIKRISILWIAPEVNSYKYNQATEISNELKECFQDDDVYLNYYVYILDKSLKLSLNKNKYKYISNIKVLVDQINSHDFSIIILDGYRFVDLIISRILKRIYLKRNFKVFYIQHGRYTKLNRKLKISNHYINKSKNYLKFFIKSFLRYPTLNLSSLFFSKAKIDYGFLYSPLSYWEIFHKTKGYSFEKFVEIRDRDTDKFTFSNLKTTNKKILYIAQTLVEDTRCDKEKQKEFASKLYEICNKLSLRLDIRPHPRSNIKFIKECFPSTNILSTEINRFDLYDCIVTHNSSLSIIFLNKNIPVLFYNLSDEPLPIGLENHTLGFKIDNFKNLRKKITFINKTKIKNKHKISKNVQRNIPSIFKAIRNISM